MGETLWYPSGIACIMSSSSGAYPPAFLSAFTDPLHPILRRLGEIFHKYTPYIQGSQSHSGRSSRYTVIKEVTHERVSSSEWKKTSS